jgi:hypothetical protein
MDDIGSAVRRMTYARLVEAQDETARLRAELDARGQRGLWRWVKGR